MNTTNDEMRDASKGAGRPQGTGKGRTVETRSVSMPPAMWDKLDALRGDRSRGEWISEWVQKARLPANAELKGDARNETHE